MSSLSKALVDATLQNVGFSKSFRSDLFLLHPGSSVSPGYCRTIIRRAGEIKLSGGVGTYFPEFEDIWRRSLLTQERRLDYTLPLIMLVENFAELVDAGTLESVDNANELTERCRSIYFLCEKFPKSIEDFCLILNKGEMVGKRFSDYLHIFDYFDDDSLYLRKSIAFIHWFIELWPNFEEKMYECLTAAQRRRLSVARPFSG